jgi:hypothetical protein
MAVSICFLDLPMMSPTCLKRTSSAQVIEHLPSDCEFLSSIPSATRKIKLQFLTPGYIVGGEEHRITHGHFPIVLASYLPHCCSSVICQHGSQSYLKHRLQTGRSLGGQTYAEVPRQLLSFLGTDPNHG